MTDRTMEPETETEPEAPTRRPLEEAKTPKGAPELEANLTLTEFKKAKGSEQRSGYVLKFVTPIDNAEVNSEDEKEIKRPLHGLLTIRRRTLFADADGQNAGTVVYTFAGKLKRSCIGARKESPAYSVWVFNLANRPVAAARQLLMDMADADGDDVEAVCEAEFRVRADVEDVPEGPELFGEDDD